ncbi:MAG TPA: sigma-70 family RNA polymerase sigma factor [Burkholderiaceae bacterium]|jgi:RNA polymerase sigma-70 factor (ECF subfamily)|nr:sigma-70 family RNA polymerase sigma factor [Burkholderiaceae bacterium]
MAQPLPERPGAAARDDDARDLALLGRIAGRDRAALEELYTLYHRGLARFLTRITYRYELAEEIINDTFWIVWQHAAEFRGASRVSTWIVGIAHRRALATLRHASVRPDVMTEEATEATDPQDTVAQRQLLDRALAALPLEQRLALELTCYLGHSCDEVAAITDCPVNTVKTRVFHARRKLQQLLPTLAGTPPPPRR